MYPNLKREKNLWKKGFKRIAGLDEAGRGCLAGPVIACAIILRQNFKRPARAGRVGGVQIPKELLKIKDSKKLSPKQREELYKLIIKHPQIEWGIGRVSEKVIDKINILEATKLAMERAAKNLEKKLAKNRKKSNRRLINFLILDGNFKINVTRKGNVTIPQKSIVKADEKVFSCACASILAKATRDRIMLRYHKKYPKYGFDKNKGYPTKYHLKMLKKYGPCKIHRKSFRPVRACKTR